jgi:hypothetical protein
VSKDSADELDFMYLRTMMSEDHLGYSLADVEKVSYLVRRAGNKIVRVWRGCVTYFSVSVHS